MDTMVVKKSTYRFLPVLFLLFVQLFVACDRSERETESRQQHIDSMMTILTQVQKNLGRIQQKEAVVERLSSSIEKREGSSVDQLGKDIYASIRFIDSTLEASRNLIQKLEEENMSSAYRIESLDNLLAEMRNTLEDKDREIRELKSEVQQLDARVSELMETVEVLDEFILEQEDILSYAYYISGTYEELAEKGILSKPGSPLSKIFDTDYYLAQDFDVALFNRIDITETRDLYFDKPVQSLRIVTPHTKDSYELVGGRTSSLLLIKDEHEFWKKSRCLVIVIDD
ncbi:MAG: biogenesis of lysosome-related organelles complex 1 subunit 2 [Chlorobiales bacterium]|nr:biogenesis of lysosome-related organelles complex 1 subunit 2 [Chlorobiales bacterium]